MLPKDPATSGPRSWPWAPELGSAGQRAAPETSQAVPGWDSDFGTKIGNSRALWPGRGKEGEREGRVEKKKEKRKGKMQGGRRRTGKVGSGRRGRKKEQRKNTF